jgi:hypothetical protein
VHDFLQRSQLSNLRRLTADVAPRSKQASRNMIPERAGGVAVGSLVQPDLLLVHTKPRSLAAPTQYNTRRILATTDCAGVQRQEHRTS